MLILVCTLMRCLRNSGFYKRYMAAAALAMRDVMSREDEPSFVIKDPRYVKESTNSTSVLHIFKGRWLVGFGWRPWVLSSASWFASPQGWHLPEVSSELLGARTHARTHARPMRLHIFFCRMKSLCSLIKSYIDLFLRTISISFSYTTVSNFMMNMFRNILGHEAWWRHGISPRESHLSG